MARALIIGGGAIGRGFVPWLLDEFELDILDASTGAEWINYWRSSGNIGHRSGCKIQASNTTLF